MLIDVNTYIGHWPFRELSNNTLPELDALAQKNGITHMLVANLNAVFYKDPLQGNLELYRELSAYSGKTKFLPFAIVRPGYPAWEQDAHDMIEKYGFKGLEICPNYHNYTLAPAPEQGNYFYIQPAVDVLKLAAELDVPVRINACFENSRQRHHMDTFQDIDGEGLYSVVSKCPQTAVIVNGTIPHGLGEHMGALLKTRNNIFFDISRLDAFIGRSVGPTIAYCGAEKLCFGTLAPFNYIDTNILKINLIDELKGDGVAFANIKNFIKL